MMTTGVSDREGKRRNRKGLGGVDPHGTNGQYRARLRLNGKTLTKVVATELQGWEQIRAWKNSSEDGTLVVGTKSTLEEVIQKWLAHEEERRVNEDPEDPDEDNPTLAESTLQGYIQKFDGYIKHAPVAKIKLSALTGDDISAFIKSLGNGKFAAAKTQSVNKALASIPITDPFIGQKRKQLAAQRPRTSNYRYSASIQRQSYAVIRDGLRWAVEEKLVSRNVAHDYKPTKAKTIAQRDSGKPGAVDEDWGYEIDALDLAKIKHKLDDPKFARLKARWMLSIQCGVRPGEALGLCWGDIDWKKQQITIRRQVQPKTGKGTIIVSRVKTESGKREIPLDDQMMELLREVRRQRRIERRHPHWTQYEFEGTPYELVFTQKNGKIIAQRLDAEHWKRLLIAAKVPHVRRYVLRHNAASQMMALPGADVIAIASIMGHSDPAFTMQRYSHALKDKKRDTMERVAAIAADDVFRMKELLEEEHGKEWMIKKGFVPNEWDEMGELVP